MLKNKLTGAALCVVTTGWAAFSLYAETVTLPPPLLERCANGNCVPRRATNGYYHTRWRKWPEEPAAPPSPGVREGIAAPPVELPEPENEGDLPEGSITQPPPPDDAGAGAAAPSPRRSGPTTAPPNGQPPRAAPPDDLPREFRDATPIPGVENGAPQFPSNDSPPRRIPALATRSANRPAAVLEALRAESNRQPRQSPNHRASAIPGILPADEIDAEPLFRKSQPTGRRLSHEEFAPTEPAAHWPPQSTWTATGGHEPDGSSARRFGVGTVTDESDREASVAVSDDSTRSASQLKVHRTVDHATSETSQLAVRRGQETIDESAHGSSGGLNRAASLRSRRTTADNPGRAPGVAELSIAAAGSEGVVIVRSNSDTTWNHPIAAKNPLRSTSASTRLVVESQSQSNDQALPEFGGDIPNNPLRAR